MSAPFFSGASKLAQLEGDLGAANITPTFDEITELDALIPPTPLYPNWFETLASDAVVCDTLNTNRKS